MNKRIVIVGAGGLARMIYSWLPDFLQNENWEFRGFISDKLSDLQNYNYDESIISKIIDYYPEENDVLVMAIADPKNKMKIAKMLESRGATFITLIHPTSIIGLNVKIGRGCVICPRSILTCDIEIENFVFININTTVGHDAKIADGVTVNAHSDVTGNTTLGRGVFLGSHSVITPNVKVQDFAKIGAGSIVVTHVKEETSVFGIPAKRI
ncbi:acetyltransferase [Bacillus sp. 1P02SD]|uniref:acetyltransferase n=1 Tax=Bacillus sp. 1P02SD TaxID=3132264 RepID=UPI0039A3564A